VLTVEPGGKLKADTGAPAGANFMLTRRLDESGRPYGEISIVRSPIAALVQQLKGILGELVIDKTGLAERFTLDVEFDNVGTARPPLTTALREAGLKLEFLTVPMDVVVIDAVQKP
jgi:uncharacterized protein (TIGR03435 family)